MNEEMCDEEKSYHEWVANNLAYVNRYKESIHVMKKLYMQGFAAGFEFKKRLTAEEYLQK